MTVMLWLHAVLLHLPDIENERLKEHLMEEVDYSLVPEAGWEKLVEWYGMAPGSIPIAREVVEYGLYLKHRKVEVYRIELQLAVYPKLTEHITKEFSIGDTVGECVLCFYIAYLSVYAMMSFLCIYVLYLQSTHTCITFIISSSCS